MIGKWLTRAGTLLIVLGIFLPMISRPSATGTEHNQSYYLVNLGSISDFQLCQPLLCLMPFCLLLVLLLTFLQPRRRSYALDVLWGQLAALGISISSLVLLLLYFIAWKQVVIMPPFVLVFLIIGYGLAFLGLALQWVDISGAAVRETQFATAPRPRGMPPPSASASATAPQTAPLISTQPELTQPRLEMIQGILSRSSIIPIQTGNFSIGRAPGNDLQLLDVTVSRQHVRLRYAEGTWFLQDQGSKSGTYVNSQRIQATQLMPGDSISIGRNTFIFRIS